MDERPLFCQICRRQATGLNYGALSCRSCKMFYKRGLSRNRPYVCLTGGKNCPTLAGIKRQCKGCRFRQCIAVGMGPRSRGKESTKNTVDRCPIPKRSATGTMRKRSLAESPVSSAGSPPLTQALPGMQDTDPLAGEADVTGPHCESAVSPDSTRKANDCFSGGSLILSDSNQIDFTFDHQPVSRAVSSVSYGSSDSEWRELDDEAETASFTRPPLQHLITNISRSTEAGNSQFLPFLDLCVGHYEANKRQIGITTRAVETALQTVFGDLLDRWTTCRDEALLCGRVVNQPETTFDDMVVAANKHTIDIILRIRKFATLLPGMEELVLSDRNSTMKGWKIMVLVMLIPAPFMTEVESYVTIGQGQYQFSRYWQDTFCDQQALVLFSYRFCTEFRKIGLNQIEQHLLMAIIMFEPGVDDSGDQSLRMKIIHRHYVDVLMDAVKRRCTDPTLLASVGAKLNRFLDLLKVVNRLYNEYFSKSTRPATEKAEFPYADKAAAVRAENVCGNRDFIHCAKLALARMTITKYVADLRGDKLAGQGPNFERIPRLLQLDAGFISANIAQPFI